MKVRQGNVIKAIMGKKNLQLGSPISPTCRKLDITLTHDLYQQHGAMKQNGKAFTSEVNKNPINQRNKHAPCTIVVMFVIRISSDRPTMNCITISV